MDGQKCADIGCISLAEDLVAANFCLFDNTPKTTVHVWRRNAAGHHTLLESFDAHKQVAWNHGHEARAKCALRPDGKQLAYEERLLDYEEALLERDEKAGVTGA